MAGILCLPQTARNQKGPVSAESGPEKPAGEEFLFSGPFSVALGGRLSQFHAVESVC
jgi:hypothetical protein